jgi:tetratricopeptide (TPR) repeat protein
VEKLGFPFSTGIASREMLDKLEFTGGIVLNGQPQLAVPTSFLIDAEGALAAIYRGPLDVSLLLSDINSLGMPLDARRDLATPLPGSWRRPPRQLLLSAVARLFEQQGYEEDYARYLQMDADIMKQRRQRATSVEQRSQWDAQYAAAHFNLGVALASSGDSQRAKKHFQSAVEAQPSHVEALINLGALLAKDNQLDGAIQSLQRAVDLDPDSTSARMNLAAALGSQNKFGQAIEHYRHVVQLQPNTRHIHARLARALLEVGDLIAAAGHLEQAVKFDARDFPSTLSLAWLRATSADAALRDGEQAVQLGQRLYQMTGGKNPLVLDVLSAAYAERGDFARAREMSAKAVAQLGSKQQALRSAILDRFKRFEAEQPHRDTDGRYP